MSVADLESNDNGQAHAVCHACLSHDSPACMPVLLHCCVAPYTKRQFSIYVAVFVYMLLVVNHSNIARQACKADNNDMGSSRRNISKCRHDGQFHDDGVPHVGLCRAACWCTGYCCHHVALLYWRSGGRSRAHTQVWLMHSISVPSVIPKHCFSRKAIPKESTTFLDSLVPGRSLQIGSCKHSRSCSRAKRPML